MFFHESDGLSIWLSTPSMCFGYARLKIGRLSISLSTILLSWIAFIMFRVFSILIRYKLKKNVPFRSHIDLLSILCLPAIRSPCVCESSQIISLRRLADSLAWKPPRNMLKMSELVTWFLARYLQSLKCSRSKSGRLLVMQLVLIPVAILKMHRMSEKLCSLDDRLYQEFEHCQ